MGRYYCEQCEVNHESHNAGEDCKYKCEEDKNKTMPNKQTIKLNEESLKVAAIALVEMTGYSPDSPGYEVCVNGAKNEAKTAIQTYLQNELERMGGVDGVIEKMTDAYIDDYPVGSLIRDSIRSSSIKALRALGLVDKDGV